MINTVIVENEQPDIDRVTSLLRSNFENVSISGIARNIPDGVEMVRSLKPELLFLDVELPPYTGFDLLKQIPQPTFEVIFTTAYDKYALPAIKSCALDYLLKPYSEEELVEAVRRFEIKRKLAIIDKRLETLIGNLSTENHNSKIALPTAKGYIFLEVKNIVHVLADNTYTTFYTTCNEQIVVSKSIKDCEEILGHHNFYRIHNSHIINLNQIKEYHRGSGGSVIMTDNSELQVSRFKRDEFLNRIEKL